MGQEAGPTRSLGEGTQAEEEGKETQMHESAITLGHYIVRKCKNG